MIAKLRPTPKILRIIVKFFVATVCGLTLGFTVQCIVVSTAQKSASGSRDFVVFWATGRQLAHHANPYDGAALLRTERAAGLSTLYGVMYMRNLPLALPLVYPLGFLSLWLASVLWAIFLLACLAASVHLLWIMHGRPKNSRHWLGYSFGPALICLMMGQTTLIVLLGLVLFLRLQGSRPFLAGISLWLCMLKPHLFVPFGLVLLIWIVVTRSYKILAGAAVALAASFWIAYLIDPMAWIQYVKMARGSGIQWDFIPCISVILRIWINKASVWIQYIPVALGSVWALSYFWPRRKTWDWMKHGSLLLLVSLLTAPYAWIYDACMVIPALLHGAYLTRSRKVLAALAFLSAMVEIALFCNVWKREALFLWTLWTAPAWLVWYLVASTPSTKWATLWPSLRELKWFQTGIAMRASSCNSGVLLDKQSDSQMEERLLGEEGRPL